jgi:citrate synthase
MAKTLHDTLAAKIPRLRKERKTILTDYGKKQISDVTINQAFGGMRGVKGMICDTSVVEPDKGLIIRGKPLLKLKNRLPEEIFWLLITGNLPKADELKLFQKQLRKYGEVPA